MTDQLDRIRQIQDEADAPRMDQPTQIALLRAVAKRYEERPPFKCGDVVKPRAYTTDGERAPNLDPYVVLEVLDKPMDSGDGSRCTMRVASVVGRGLFVTWTEHWGWEPYTEDGTPGTGQGTLQ